MSTRSVTDSELERRLADQPNEVRQAIRAVRASLDEQDLTIAERQAHHAIGARADTLVGDALRLRIQDRELLESGLAALEAWARAADATLLRTRTRTTRVQLLGGTIVSMKTACVVLALGSQRGSASRDVVYPALAELGIVDQATPALRYEVVWRMSKLGSPSRARRELARRGIHVRWDSISRWIAASQDQTRHPREPPQAADPVPRSHDESQSSSETAPPWLADVNLSEIDIPVDTTPEVEACVEFFVEGNGRHTFQRWLERAPAFQPAMHEALERRGLPRDLVYLSMIESGYQLDAFSSAQAAGLWQFIEPTARAYGLQIDDWVDERFDPDRSLEAALDYLEDLHADLGDWRLAWAAYNTGVSRVKQALARLNTRDWWTLARSQELHPETRGYVPMIMAAALAGHTAAQRGFTIPREPSTDVRVVDVPGLVDLRGVAKSMGIELGQLLSINPALRRSATPPGGYALRVPADKAKTVLADILALPRGGRIRMNEIVVHRGEALDALARRAGVSVAVLRTVNSLGDDEPTPGTTLQVPALPPPLSPPSIGTVRVHLVRPGDTTSRIARRYEMSIRALVTLNRLDDPDNIEIGQRLRVLDRRRTPARRRSNEAGDWVVYRVRPGDNLARVARAFGVTVESLTEWNSLSRLTVSPGQRLRVQPPAR